MADNDTTMFVGEAAQELGLDDPTELTRLIYRGKIKKSRLTRTSRGWQIPADYLDEIRELLLEKGAIAE